MTTLDGGDQVAALLALLLVPISLTDSRRWHWHPCFPRYVEVQGWSLLAIRMQCSVIYLQACLAKLSVPEWVDGTALYYWMRHPSFGPPEPLRALTDTIFLYGPPVAAVTWGTLVLEFCLGIACILPRAVRPPLLSLGITFHLVIACAMGLWSFAIAMWAVLLLLLHPGDVSFRPTPAHGRAAGAGSRAGP